jgi:hypothetical protein
MKCKNRSVMKRCVVQAKVRSAVRALERLRRRRCLMSEVVSREVHTRGIHRKSRLLDRPPTASMDLVCDAVVPYASYDTLDNGVVSLHSGLAVPSSLGWFARCARDSAVPSSPLSRFTVGRSSVPPQGFSLHSDLILASPVGRSSLPPQRNARCARRRILAALGGRSSLPPKNARFARET